MQSLFFVETQALMLFSNISLANIQISQALILFENIQISRGRGVYISQTKYPSSWQTVIFIGR